MSIPTNLVATANGSQVTITRVTTTVLSDKILESLIPIFRQDVEAKLKLAENILRTKFGGTSGDIFIEAFKKDSEVQEMVMLKAFSRPNLPEPAHSAHSVYPKQPKKRKIAEEEASTTLMTLKSPKKKSQQIPNSGNRDTDISRRTDNFAKCLAKCNTLEELNKYRKEEYGMDLIGNMARLMYLTCFDEDSEHYLGLPGACAELCSTYNEKNYIKSLVYPNSSITWIKLYRKPVADSYDCDCGGKAIVYTPYFINMIERSMKKYKDDTQSPLFRMIWNTYFNK